MRIRARVPDPATGEMVWGWKDLGEGYAATGHHSGALVVGQPGAEERRRAAVRASKAKRKERSRCDVVILAEPCSRPVGHPGRHRHYWNRAA